MIATTRTYRIAAVLLALVFGVFLVQGGGVDAKIQGTSKVSAEQLANSLVQVCQALGGTATIHYNLDSNGGIDSINVTCDGGGKSTKMDCTYYQGAYTTTFVCALVPGETESSDHTPIGDGVLEEVEPTTEPVHGDLEGGTLDPTGAGDSRPVVTSGTFATTVQEDDDERP